MRTTLSHLQSRTEGLSFILPWIVSASVLSGCHGAEDTTPVTGAPASEGAPLQDDTVTDDTGVVGDCDVYPVFASNGCTGCHDATPGLYGGDLDLLSTGLEQRLAGQASNHYTCDHNLLVDPSFPEASLLLHTVAPDTYAEHGDPDCGVRTMPPNATEQMAAEDVACIEAWIRGLDEVTVEEPAPFDATTPYSAINKAKYLVHGGAVTDEELAYAIDESGELDLNALRVLIDDWMWAEPGVFTDEFDAKLDALLDLTLQQNGTGGGLGYLFGAQLKYGHRAADYTRFHRRPLADSLHDMFTATARDIVEESGDFRQVVTTRRWKVTTAILLALSRADSPSSEAIVLFEHLEDDDYYDWRYVNIKQATNTTPADHQYENSPEFASALRSIGAEGSIRLWAPRVGFFNTIPFFDEWETNDDNDFRVTLNQTLIGALDLIYETSDTTPPESLNGVDDVHANPATSCYSCHSLMDPTRLIFSKYYTTQNRAHGYLTDDSATFAFHGYAVADIETMDDFAAALVKHPRFAAAWTQKICMWANAQRCDETDPEFVRVAETFKVGYDEHSPDDDFRFNILMREMLSSPLVTAADTTQSHETTEYVVSTTRLQHFCNSLNVRVRQAADLRCAEEGRDVSECTAYSWNCSRWDTAQGLGADAYGRGTVAFTTPMMPDPIYTVALRQSCYKAANKTVKNGSAPFKYHNVDPENIIRRMVQTIMGLPPSHPRHAAANETLLRTYAMLVAEGACPDGQTIYEANEAVATGDAFVCGLGLDTDDALRNVFTIACEAPEISTTGL
ncbi:MAG: hypothetical protein AAFV53_36480 [Myxococcota bacterium]